MRARTTHLLEGDLLTRDRGDLLGCAGQQVRAVLHHHHEVGERGRRGGRTRHRTQYDGDLRHDPARVRAAAQHSAVDEVSGWRPIRRGRVMDPDDRGADRQRQVQDGSDDVGGGAPLVARTWCRRVLTEDADDPPVHRAMAGDHSGGSVVEADQRTVVQRCGQPGVSGALEVGPVAHGATVAPSRPRSRPCVPVPGAVWGPTTLVA